MKTENDYFKRSTIGTYWGIVHSRVKLKGGRGFNLLYLILIICIQIDKNCLPFFNMVANLKFIVYTTVYYAVFELGVKLITILITPTIFYINLISFRRYAIQVRKHIHLKYTRSHETWFLQLRLNMLYHVTSFYQKFRIWNWTLKVIRHFPI